jgi:hypothetical protein
MPGELATSINFNYFGPIVGPLRFFGSLACGINAVVLKQDHCVWPGFCYYPFMYFALQFKTRVVGYKVRGQTGDKKFWHQFILRVIPNLDSETQLLGC